ncbi:MAG: hypothetical protein JWR67_2585 [Mucilaginibacter sp.]|nr:hypothetical protein [Mucilaginibacter sp.]
MEEVKSSIDAFSKQKARELRALLFNSFLFIVYQCPRIPCSLPQHISAADDQ